MSDKILKLNNNWNHKLNNNWNHELEDYFLKDNWKKLSDFIISEYKDKTIYPTFENLFRAFDLVKFSEVKVVIIGQDPYHNQGQANGLSFSVNDNSKIPPSLRNIYKEIESDLKVKKDFNNGNLKSWADQGVLLLNSVLSVVANQAASHKGIGWENFTDEVIKRLSVRREGLVFILWGNFAKSKVNLIDKTKHLIIESNHPSPFSANKGFFGSKPFSKTNDYLIKNGIQEIVW